MITVTPYQEIWPKRFQEEKQILNVLFQKIPVDLHHIGSTAVIGLSAKPIIDILGVTPDITLIDALNVDLEELGYEPLGEFGMKQRRFFRKKDTFHLHIFEDSDPDVCRHLRFVAYVSAHPEAVANYSTLKQKLAVEHSDDMTRYLLGKEGWIKQVDISAAKERIGPAFYPPMGPRKAKWSSEEIVKALHVNMHLHMVNFSKYHPRIQRVFQPDVTLLLTDVPDDFFNYVLSARFQEKQATERIHYVLQLYQQKGNPFSWWISLNEDTPHTLSSLLENEGLAQVEEAFGMYLELDTYETVKKGEEIHRVEIDERMRDFTHVVASVSGSPDIYQKFYRDLPQILYQEGAALEMYVLYHDSLPICTGMALFHANVMGIYYITTLPQYRRRGFATEMMQYLLARGKAKGYHIATLEASEQGKKVYEKLGFTECCRFLEYKK